MNKIILMLPIVVITLFPGCKSPAPVNNESPFCFTCHTAIGGTIFFNHYANDEEEFNIQYSFDKNKWIDIDIDLSLHQYPIFVNCGESVYFRGNNPTGFTTMRDVSRSTEEIGRISTFTVPDGDFTVSGNVMSLIKPTGFENITTLPCASCFAQLFNLPGQFNSSNSSVAGGALIDAKDLILPATTLTDYCYFKMFDNCHYLQTAPILPATVLAEGCYEAMFRQCESLKRSPDLLATTNQL